MALPSRLEKPLVIAGSLLCLLLALEVGLRLLGGAFSLRQDWANRAALLTTDAIRVACIGESTTALGARKSYPSQLEEILDERSPGPDFTVVNLGIGGADSSVILEQLEEDLERYRPHIVVSMMGANDVATTAYGHYTNPIQRSIPDLGIPLAERGGAATWFKTWRLVELLWFHTTGGAEVQASTVERPDREGPPRRPPRGTSKQDIPTEVVATEIHTAPLVEVLDTEMKAFVGLPRAERDPDVHRAWAAMNSGRAETAEQHFQKAMRRSSDPVRTRLEYALFLELEDRDDEALTVLAEALANEDAPPVGHAILGRIHSRHRRCAEAASAFEKAIRGDPVLGFVMATLGVCWSQVSEEDLADEAFQRAVGMKHGLRFQNWYRLAPPSSQRRRLGRAPFPKNSLPARFDALFEVREEPVPRNPLLRRLITAEQVNPQDMEGSIPRLAYLDALGDTEALEAFLQQMEESNPTDVVLRGIGRYFQEQGDPERAAEWLNRADDTQAAHDASMTRQNYQKLQEILDERNIQLVVVQYPTLRLQPLKDLVDWGPGVVFVDNEQSFLDAIEEQSYEALFWDECYGTFGHGSKRGNRLLAQNVADAILPLLEE